MKTYNEPARREFPRGDAARAAAQGLGRNSQGVRSFSTDGGNREHQQDQRFSAGDRKGIYDNSREDQRARSFQRQREQRQSTDSHGQRESNKDNVLCRKLLLENKCLGTVLTFILRHCCGKREN